MCKLGAIPPFKPMVLAFLWTFYADLKTPIYEQRKSERGSVSLKPLNLKGKTDKESSFLKAASAGKVDKLQSSIKARKVRLMNDQVRREESIEGGKR